MRERAKRHEIFLKKYFELKWREEQEQEQARLTQSVADLATLPLLLLPLATGHVS